MSTTTRDQKTTARHWMPLQAPKVLLQLILDVLNNMILPRDWRADNGKHFMQYVSHQKSERSDVVRLKGALDRAL